VNPARNKGPAVFVGGWALEQLWLFWVAPIIGAVVAGRAYGLLAQDRPEPEERGLAAGQSVWAGDSTGLQLVDLGY